MLEEMYWQHRNSEEMFISSRLFEKQTNILVEQQEYNLFSMLKPSIKKDGNQWCVLYGVNIMEGIAGFGETPYLAILNFNKTFHQQ